MFILGVCVSAMMLRVLLLLLAAGGTIGQWEYVTFEQGELPLLLAVPHGGSMTPGEIPDRSIDTRERELVQMLLKPYVERVAELLRR
jgi:hypothetical protein